MLGMCQVELLTNQEFYASFIKLPAVPSGAWVRGWVVNNPLAWWTQAFEHGYMKFTTTFPHCNDIRAMVVSHFEQLVCHNFLKYYTV
jgi:hypothetical protein